eukprot:TRINITY_DN34019_c0_g1_i1.p1 TRINITY_DN34019_c0_g1~~TRINITY_DN34019_c0_g1_i1.p1  ORF type:complete len:127 (-),score=3.42 TRINITY_DN34019_c0_g1_i1:117-497(-)
MGTDQIVGEKEGLSGYGWVGARAVSVWFVRILTLLTEKRAVDCHLSLERREGKGGKGAGWRMTGEADKKNTSKRPRNSNTVGFGGRVVEARHITRRSHLTSPGLFQFSFRVVLFFFPLSDCVLVFR